VFAQKILKKNLINTKLQNTKHRITRNRQMVRQTDRQTVCHAHTKLFKRQIDTKTNKHDHNVE